jgi:hypothetical protein
VEHVSEGIGLSRKLSLAKHTIRDKSSKSCDFKEEYEAQGILKKGARNKKKTIERSGQLRLFHSLRASLGGEARLKCLGST